MKLIRMLIGLVMVFSLALVSFSPVDGPRDDTYTRSLEALNTFLYEYNVNTTHGFRPLAPYETISRAEAETMYLPFTFADFLACKEGEDELPLTTCLAEVSNARFINAYVIGTLR